MIELRTRVASSTGLLLTSLHIWAAMALARLRAPDRDRGDVPGWVMITVMTAALVLAILIPFREAIVTAITNALNSVTSQ